MVYPRYVPETCILNALCLVCRHIMDPNREVPVVTLFKAPRACGSAAAAAVEEEEAGSDSQASKRLRRADTSEDDTGEDAGMGLSEA
jgi:hypothetical protein